MGANKYGTWQERILANKPKPSNADRIRGMTDEELAMFLQDIWYISGSNDTPHEWWLNWLRKEASDGNT